MELKLPQEETIAPRYLHTKSDFVQAHYHAMHIADKEAPIRGTANPANPWGDMADSINRKQDAMRAIYDREMLKYLEEHDWNLEYYCNPGYGESSITLEDFKDEKGRNIVTKVPFNYFAAPVKPGKGFLVRDAKPVYYNKTKIPDPVPEEYLLAEAKYKDLARPLPEVKVPSVSWYYDGKRSPLVPLLLTILPVIFVWNMRYGSVDGVAIQQSLQAAMQQNPLMQALCFIPEWIMGVLNAFIEFVGSDGSVDSEILGGIIIYAVLGVFACIGIFFALALGISNKSNRIRNRKQWRALRKEAKAAKAENREIRAQNVQRQKDAEAYRNSSEYKYALQLLQKAKADAEKRRQLAEQWHRAWYKVVCSNWDQVSKPLEPIKTHQISDEEFQKKLDEMKDLLDRLAPYD